MKRDNNHTLFIVLTSIAAVMVVYIAMLRYGSRKPWIWDFGSPHTETHYEAPALPDRTAP